MSRELEQLIARDALFCQAMSDEMDEYLDSKVLFWEPDRGRPGGAELPMLTIGGLLLALRRLETLRARLEPDQLRALSQARRVLDASRSERRIRYETKLGRDLHSRLDAWAWYLEECEEQGEPLTAHYAHRVEERVKIELLLQEAGEIDLEVEESRQRQAALDQRLRENFVAGDFVWPEPLAKGFPPPGTGTLSPRRFWYLYGEPQVD